MFEDFRGISSFYKTLTGKTDFYNDMAFIKYAMLTIKINFFDLKFHFNKDKFFMILNYYCLKTKIVPLMTISIGKI